MLRMVLTKLPGVTERMATKMKEHFGSEEAVVSTLASGDVGRLAEVEGLSGQTSAVAGEVLCGR